MAPSPRAGQVAAGAGTEPRRCAAAQDTTALSHRSVHTPSTAVHRPVRSELRAICGGVPETCVSGRRAFAMFALRGAAGPSSPISRVLASRRGGLSRASCPSRSCHTPGTASARSCDARSATPRGTSGSSALSRGALEATTLVLEAPDDSPRLGRGQLRAPARRLHRAPCSARASRVQIVARRRRHACGRRPRGAAPRPQRRFNPRLTFDQFVIGDGNRLAHAAALAVAEMPGLAYNPLFICGPPGLGKTHLLHSIANYVTEHGDGLTVRYTTAEAFTDHFVGALHTGAHRGLQGGLPRRRRPARRRRPVPAEQGAHRAGVLPHLQRAARAPARSSCSPPTGCRATSTRSRTACASASSPAW